MTTAPGLSHEPCTRRGWPTAATSTSAVPTSCSTLRDLECTCVTVQLRARSMLATGFPTMSLRPMTTACRPSRLSSALSRRRTTPAGVHGKKCGLAAREASKPMLSEWKPSTSLDASIASVMRRSPSASTCGTGSWTRMPSTDASALRALTWSSTSRSVEPSGSAMCIAWMPHSSAARRFMRIYVEDAPSSPTWTIASDGVMSGRRARSAATRDATDSRTDLVSRSARSKGGSVKDTGGVGSHGNMSDTRNHKCAPKAEEHAGKNAVVYNLHTTARRRSVPCWRRRAAPAGAGAPPRSCR